MNESYDYSETMGPNLEEELEKQDWVDSAIRYTMTVLYVKILCFSLFGNSLVPRTRPCLLPTQLLLFSWM